MAEAKTGVVPIADVDDVDRSPFNDDNEFDTATPASSFSSSLASKIFNIEKRENLERRHYYYGNNDWKRKTHTHYEPEGRPEEVDAPEYPTAGNDDNDTIVVGGQLTVPSEGMNNNNNNSNKRSHPSVSTSSSSSSSSSLLLRDKNHKTTKRALSTLLLSSSSNNSNDSNKLTVTPISLLLHTTGYMDNDTLVMMCLVSKQINELIKNGEGMERQLIRVFEWRPSGENQDNHWDMKGIELFLSNMNRYWQDGTKRRMLQGYQHMKIYDPPKILAFHIDFNESARLVSPHLRMTGIVDLDISSPVPNRIMGNCALVHLVALLVPNLRKLDISNLCIDQDIMKKLSQRCPHLEALKWNKWDNDDDFDFFPANGRFLKSFKNLKKLYWDGGTISFTADIDEGRRMAVMESYPNEFIFHELCKNNPLERVSNRHARSRSFRHDRYNAAEFDPIAQNVLINFVRNVPSTLVWFRSDLSTENIRMLQLERPGIELVN